MHLCNEVSTEFVLTICNFPSFMNYNLYLAQVGFWVLSSYARGPWLLTQVARARLGRWRSGGTQSTARWRCTAGNMRIQLMFSGFVWVLFCFPFLSFSLHDFICKKPIVFRLQCSQRLLGIAYLCCCPRKFGIILLVLQGTVWLYARSLFFWSEIC